MNYYAVRSESVNGIYDNQEFKTKLNKTEKIIVKRFSTKELAEEFMKRPLEEVLNEINEKRELKRKKNKERDERLKKGRKLDIYIDSSEYLCFLDVEASDGQAISLGAVIYDSSSKKIVKTFYELLNPLGFKEMRKYEEHLTGIKTEDVLNARNYNEVFIDFSQIIEEYDIQTIYTWGASDKHYIKNACVGTSYPFFSKIKNIQTIISSVTDSIYHNNRWSLKNMKKFYNLEGDVLHNSLSDAIDLTNIFSKYMDKTEIDKEIIMECVSKTFK